MKTILVYGATGLTGGLTVEALLARGVRPLLAGRDRARLAALAARHGLSEDAVVVADATHPPDVARMVERAGVVLACAGPFVELGEPTVAACAARGVHYADSTGEGPFVQMIARRYDATASARGCALAPSCAFEVAVADAAVARAAAGLGEGLDVEVAYATADAPVSRGTRASVVLMLGHGGMALRDGEVHDEPLAAHVRRVAFQSPIGEQTVVSFAGPEVFTVPRHVAARGVRVFMRAPAAAALHLASRAIGPVAAFAGPALRALARGGAAGPSPEERRAGRFQVVATVRSADGKRGRRVTVAGSDPYGLSAALLAEAAMAMAQDRVTARGMVAPTQVLGAERIFRIVEMFDSGGVGVQDL